jgi:hypothetical protein
MELTQVHRRYKTSTTRPAEENPIKVQNVGVVNINPEKLMDKLRSRFPSGFEVQVLETRSYQVDVR